MIPQGRFSTEVLGSCDYVKLNPFVARGEVLIEDKLHVRPVLSLAGKVEAQQRS